MNDLIMRYTLPAENSIEGWEKQSLPLGNGFFGASIFGGVNLERIQITENSFTNPLNQGGLTNFLDIFIETEHTNVSRYERGLNLSKATSFTSYNSENTEIHREFFVSHPKKMLCGRFTSEKHNLNLKIFADIPFVKGQDFEHGVDRSGNVVVNDSEIVVSGILYAYELKFYAKIKIVSDGICKSNGNAVEIENAKTVDLFFSCDTSYELSEKIFLEEDFKKKLGSKNPTETVEKLFKSTTLDFEALKNEHICDYTNLFDRATLELFDDNSLTVPQMLERMRNGESCPYLLMLYFAYGRYLLISSSREDTLPANLQGVWNAHPKAPWSSGYWHNINVQMNYWHAFSTDLAECFEAYKNYNLAFRPKARQLATKFLKEHDLNYSKNENQNGWTIGTAATPYVITEPGGHSGPGTGGLTSKLFWDYYDFTRNKSILENCALNTLEEMAVFLMNCTKEYDGRILSKFSASPEQLIHGFYRPWPQYHQTVGCAFDQQMIFENGKDLIKASNILGVTDAVIEKQRSQLDKYNPVSIGKMGQIKEYDEETYYGDIGEYEHRHISNLVGLYPGTSISNDTPAWLDSAKITLTKRSDISTGWALAHRLNAWARIGDGEHCYTLLKNLLCERTFDNLWDAHPPFQIDGNFGATAGISEMLLQSHESSIKILPALPSEFKNGKVKGLVARGNFKFDIEWENGVATKITVLSRNGGEISVFYKGFKNITVLDENEMSVCFTNEDNVLKFCTKKDKTYTISNISSFKISKDIENLNFSANDSTVRWTPQNDTVYNIYCAENGSPNYKLLATTKNGEYRISDFGESVIYKITATDSDCEESKGKILVLYKMSELDCDKYLTRLRNLNIELEPNSNNDRYEKVFKKIKSNLLNGCVIKEEVF